MADSRGRYSRYTAGNSGGVAGRAPLNGDGGNGRRQRPDDQGTGNRRRRTERRRGRFLWAKLLVAVIFPMLFEGTYTGPFYRHVRDLLHDEAIAANAEGELAEARRRRLDAQLGCKGAAARCSSTS